MDPENAEWKKNLALIHRRQTPSRSIGHGKENSKNMSHHGGESLVDRDYDQESLAFIDPAIQMFGSSTPKYKMKAHESPNITDSKRLTDSVRQSKWDAQKSTSSQDGVKKIIDYRSNQVNEQRDSVNMQTPTRHDRSNIESPPDVVPEHDTSGTDIVRTLDFNSSVDGDGTFIIAGSGWKEISDDRTGMSSAGPMTPEGKELAGPKADVSPETEVLKQSSLQGDLKSKIPSSVRKSETPGSRPSVSPTQSKLDSDFAQHLVATMRTTDDIDCSFVDALTSAATDTLAVISTPISTKATGRTERPHTKPVTMAASPAPAMVPDSARKTPSCKGPEGHGGEGLDLHDEWKETITPQGKKYYYNRRTRMSAWA
jgi:hypothetical protein